MKTERNKGIFTTMPKYLLLWAILLLPAIGWHGCGDDKPSDKVEVSGIELNKTHLSLAKGVDAAINAKVLPFAVRETPVTWESSNPTVASVDDNGKVTANAYGTAVITAKAGDKAVNSFVTVKSAIVGVYYFDGWSGRNNQVFPDLPDWPENPPTHLTKRFVREFSDRMPIWGWRNDTQEIMEQQIDLMADNGVDFMLYCWYWADNRSFINEQKLRDDPKHTSLSLYQTAKNKKRLQYALLIANHEGAEIIGVSNWEAAVEHWAQYFRDPQYIQVDGKPLLVLFGTGDVTDEDIDRMQETAKRLGFKDGLSIAGCGGANAVKDKRFDISTHYNVTTGYSSGSAEKHFQVLIDNAKPQWRGTEEQPYIPVINSGWDKRPWEGPDGFGQGQVEGWYFTGDTPELFQSFLGDAITWMDNNPHQTTKERLTLIYAWNELGEGGWLTPTIGDPEASKLKKIGELLKERSK